MVLNPKETERRRGVLNPRAWRKLDLPSLPVRLTVAFHRERRTNIRRSAEAVVVVTPPAGEASPHETDPGTSNP